ncbi:hypothetical protein [Gracilimonas sp.]|uniref:rolling circle replication-associated protein n=1 Tax=Gracilimonas sp. TaxID=1974203 RepID=UPI0032EE23FD
MSQSVIDDFDFQLESPEIQSLIRKDIKRYQKQFYCVSEEQRRQFELLNTFKRPYYEAKHNDYHSKGLIEVHGNSCKITLDPLTDIQKFGKLRDELQRQERPSERITDNVNFNHQYKKTGKAFFKRVDDDYANEPPKRRKGDIKGLTKNSRRRLLIRVNQCNPDDITKFFHVVLTYPSRYPADGKEHKADLDAFLKRCKRKYSEEIEYLWRLEFQGRGAPHYHLMMYLPEDQNIVDVRKWILQNWYEVAQRFWDTKLIDHSKVGTSVDRMFSLKGGRYLTKYIAKSDDDIPENQGRLWGCSRNWGDVVLKQVELTKKQLIHFRRLVKRFLKGQKRMQKMATQPMNLVVFGHWSFFTHAIDWVKDVY